MNKYLDQFDENNNIRLINSIKQQNKKNFDKILPKINNLNYERWEYYTPYSPLMYASDLEDIYFAQELIKAGADVNFQNSKNKITPLMVASARGNVPFIELLIKNRVDINAETKNGSVALGSAIVNRRFDVVKLLHEHGAKLQDKDCVFDAIESGETRIVKYFINNGVNVNKRDKKGNTLIMRSLINQDHHMASNLLELNADVNTKNNQGMTPLMLLIINGYKKLYSMKLFEKIINHTLDINTKNNKSMTALMYAVDKCDIKVIELLLEKGAIISLKDNKGRTALDIAKHKLNKKTKKEKEDKLMIVLKNKLFTESIEKTVDLSGKISKKKNKM